MYSPRLSWLFPQRCVVCGCRGVEMSGGVGLCCSSLVESPPEPLCPVCGRHVGIDGACGACLCDSPPFDRMAGAAVFKEPLAGMIHAFKYHRATYLKTYLAGLVHDTVREELKQCDVITFVPLHWTRIVLRGYNQAALLAGELARRSGKRVDGRILKKTRGTPAQVGLMRRERERNVKDAFRARGVRGKAVMVVDDVITTGSTAFYVSKALKDAGAARVVFAAVGRVYR